MLPAFVSSTPYVTILSVLLKLYVPEPSEEYIKDSRSVAFVKMVCVVLYSTVTLPLLCTEVALAVPASTRPSSAIFENESVSFVAMLFPT